MLAEPFQFSYVTYALHQEIKQRGKRGSAHKVCKIRLLLNIPMNYETLISGKKCLKIAVQSSIYKLL